MIAGLTACNSKKQKFEFDHAQEAIAACHQELATVKNQQEATIDELVTRINIWQELQDSTLTLMVRDSTLQNDARLASEFFAVTDSFRMVITRLALAKQRSMADVVKLKVGTSASRKAMLTSDEFRSARQYYLDFNRRILQSAETCRNDIKAAIKREENQIHLSSPEREQARPKVKTQKPLDTKQSANYRWLLIQPFLAMDNYATAMLTPQQEQTLTHLAEELQKRFVMLFIITGEVDERIIANLMGFLEATESMEKFKTDDLELTALNDGNQATVTIPLTHQEMIDDLIDLLVSKLLLQVLYLYSDKAGNNFYALAYSMPYQDEMYVVRIASHQCGIIDEIHVEFYASIETVFTFLKQELERLEQPQPDLDIEELQRLDALLINFL